MADRDITYLKSITMVALDKSIKLPALYEPGGILYEVLVVLNEGNANSMTWRHDAAEKASRLCKVLGAVTATSEQAEAYCRSSGDIVLCAATPSPRYRADRKQQESMQQQMLASPHPDGASTPRPLRRSARNIQSRKSAPASQLARETERQDRSNNSSLLSPASIYQPSASKGLRQSSSAHEEKETSQPKLTDVPTILPRQISCTTSPVIATIRPPIETHVHNGVTVQVLGSSETCVEKRAVSQPGGTSDNRRAGSSHNEGEVGFGGLAELLDMNLGAIEPTNDDMAGDASKHGGQDEDEDADTVFCIDDDDGNDNAANPTNDPSNHNNAHDECEPKGANGTHEAQEQLAAPTAWLSDNTISIIQSIIWTQAKASVHSLEGSVQLLDPLYVQIDSGTFDSGMPRLFERQLKARCILVPLHHQSPQHWTLAIILPAYRQILWYDSLNSVTRAERTEVKIRRWAEFAIPGIEPFQYLRLVSSPFITTHFYLYHLPLAS